MTWKILPHGKLEALSQRIHTVTGELKMPLTMLERRMSIVAISGKRLIIYSAIALDEQRMRDVEALGTPAFLIVPNRMHRTDAAGWKARYPAMQVVCPSGARAKVEEVCPVDTVTPDFGDASVRFLDIAGTDGGEGALEVQEDGRATVIVADLIGHLPKSHGYVLRMLGFAGSAPQVPRAARMALVKDKRAFRSQLESWSRTPLARIIVAHGAPIVHDPSGALSNMARQV